jgi:hypothetical protein
MTVPSRVRIFISYKRNVTPDEQVAIEVFRALSEQPQYDVFIDQTMLVGTEWAKRIEEELHRSDYLISFLSENSVRSEMVLAEIETAHHLGKRNGSPRILPVRLAYQEAFVYPLSAYLNPLNWALWHTDADTPKLIEQLLQAISHGHFAPDTQSRVIVSSVPPEGNIPPPTASAQILPNAEAPEGTMNPESHFYIEREEDATALRLIKEQGVTVTIKGPRQMGKSSLLIRVIDMARKNDKSTILLDFQLFDKAAFSDADKFFYQFALWITDELDLEDRLAEYWSMPLGNSQRCTRYFERYILKEVNKSLVLAMDEVESVFDTDFRTDFFSMLRSWHNNRASKPVTWQKLDLALVTSTEPYQFIDNLNLSPFNVGVHVDLTDFTPDQITKLNQLHGSPLQTTETQQLMQLLNGHPYLTRKAMYAVVTQQMSASSLLSQNDHDAGPFGDHLRYHLFRLQGKNELIQGMRQTIQQHACHNEEVFFRLQSAGLIRRQGTAVVPRCKLYEEYFRRHLNV